MIIKKCDLCGVEVEKFSEFDATLELSSTAEYKDTTFQGIYKEICPECLERLRTVYFAVGTVFQEDFSSVVALLKLKNEGKTMEDYDADNDK